VTGPRVEIDVAAVTALAAELAAAAAELARIAAATQLVAVHPAVMAAAPRAPVRVARALAHLEPAVRGLAALPLGYTALSTDAARQAAELAAAEASDAVLAGAGVLVGAPWGIADATAGALVSAGLRSADPAVLLVRGALDAWIPEGPGVVREVPAPAGTQLATIDDLYRRVGGLRPGEVEVTPVRGADGTVRYLVLLRGMEPSLNPTLNTPGQAVKSSRGADAHTRAVAAAMRRAGVPPGAELMLAGHSQGGITAMNLAAAGGYRVTHVVTAGSPIANKRAGRARVLALEHQGDLVPDLDGAEETANRWLAVHRFGGDRRISRVAAHHGLRTGYLPELATPGFAADPGVRGWLEGTAPYLAGQPGPPRRFRLDSGPYPEPDAVRIARDLVAGSRRRDPLTGPGAAGA